MDIFIPQHTQRQKEKIAALMGVTPSGLVIGDVRSDLQRTVLQSLERVVEANHAKERYWILVHANADPWLSRQTGKRAFATKIMLLGQAPPKMLGCMCFFVDNRASDVRLEWVLPLDTVGPPGTDSGVESKVVNDSARGVPVLNG